MKIPKHIDKLLSQHEKLGCCLQDKNSELFKWFNENGIYIEIDNIYCHNSIMIITEPTAYVDGIRNLIREYENER